MVRVEEEVVDVVELDAVGVSWLDDGKVKKNEEGKGMNVIDGGRRGLTGALNELDMSVSGLQRRRCSHNRRDESGEEEDSGCCSLHIGVYSGFLNTLERKRVVGYIQGIEIEILMKDQLRIKKVYVV
jgi:hypothetical protein